jgi:hypothetical protein
MYQVVFRNSDSAIPQAHSSVITEITVSSVKFSHTSSDVDWFHVLYETVCLLFNPYLLNI